MDVYQAYNKLTSFRLADEIAEFFKELGIKGRIEDTNSCPIANYFHAAENVESVTVDDYVCIELSDCDDGEYYREWFDSTPAIADFIKSFDTGQYPELRVV